MEALRLGLYTWFGRMLCILFTSLTHALLTSGITLRAIRKFFSCMCGWGRGIEGKSAAPGTDDGDPTTVSSGLPAKTH